MHLVIVESPTKAKKISQYLGSEYNVQASFGHVRDLPKSDLGVDVENNFQLSYKLTAKRDVISRLKESASKAQSIILATDPDREGEAIAWHIQHILTTAKTHKVDKKKFKRAVFYEITKQAVLDAIAQASEINLALVDAQQARRALDRLVGYKVSPVLWRKVRRGLSAGRVQSVALRLLVEKEREIINFKPEEYWDIDVLLSTDLQASKRSVFNASSSKTKSDLSKSSSDSNSSTLSDSNSSTLSDSSSSTLSDLNSSTLSTKPGSASAPADLESSSDNVSISSLQAKIKESELLAKLVSIDNKKFAAKSAEEVNFLPSFLKSADFRVDKVDSKKRKRSPAPAFTTSTLQQQASSKFGYSGKRTMQLAQKLYEEGLITYHRTDSVNVSSSAISMVRNYLSQNFSKQYLPEKPNYYKSKSKNAQEAHEAIRVTDVGLHSDRVFSKASDLTSQHQKLYDLIWKRFVASQMSSAEFMQTSIMIEAKNNNDKRKLKFSASGSVMVFPGWLSLFPQKDEVILPPLQENQSLSHIDSLIQQKFTQPPARFNDASLVKELEKRGIGRPSTYASIISVLIDRGYVERQQRRFFVSAVGMAVEEFLSKYFAVFMDYDFTAKMEDDLDAIALGKMIWHQVLSSFYTPFQEKIDDVLENAKRVQIAVESTGEVCPECQQGEQVIRTGKFGKFKSCSRFPECKFTQNIVETISGNCPVCEQGAINVKKSRWGKPFFGCSRYPECDWASWQKPEENLKISAEEWEQMKKERAEKMKKRKSVGKNRGGKSDAKTKVKSNAKTKVKSNAKTKSKNDAKAKSKNDAKTKVKSDVKTKRNSKSKTVESEVKINYVKAK